RESPRFPTLPAQGIHSKSLSHHRKATPDSPHGAAIRKNSLPAGNRLATSLLRRLLRPRRRIVVQHRRQPSLRLLRRPALAPRVVLDLVALDLADTEIVALRVAEVEAAYRGAGPHGEALGELDAG